MKKQPFEKPDLRVEDLTTALYEANKELTRINRQLGESERRRGELLANLSHDLRAPIAAVRSYTEYLLAFTDLEREEITDTLGHVQSRVLELERLVNQMLELTVLDAASEEQLQYAHLEARAFLEDFFHGLRADRAYADCELRLELPESFPHTVSIDPALLGRALENLAANARKYSNPPRRITLGAEQREHAVIIRVADNGIGIAEADKERIFERTYMVSPARTPGGVNGCGLGLSIVESIVERHKGQVWCESEPGRGSTFYISLPQAGEDLGLRPNPQTF